MEAFAEVEKLLENNKIPKGELKVKLGQLENSFRSMTANSGRHSSSANSFIDSARDDIDRLKYRIRKENIEHSNDIDGEIKLLEDSLIKINNDKMELKAKKDELENKKKKWYKFQSSFDKKQQKEFGILKEKYDTLVSLQIDIVKELKIYKSIKENTPEKKEGRNGQENTPEKNADRNRQEQENKNKQEKDKRIRELEEILKYNPGKIESVEEKIKDAKERIEQYKKEIEDAKEELAKLRSSGGGYRRKNLTKKNRKINRFKKSTLKRRY